MKYKSKVAPWVHCESTR